jgi:hypothetical protein
MQERMTAVNTSTRIPLEAMERIITAALEGLDLSHDCEWTRPESCPACHASGGEERCLIPMEEGRCEGHTAEAGTPPEHQVTAAILISALPPDSGDGTVDAQEAALSLIQVIEARLPFSYTLRRDHLRKRLVAAAEEYELAHGAVSDVPPSPGYSPKCQWCTAPIAAARGPKARYCSNSHRVMASRARKREAERVNATASPGR